MIRIRKLPTYLVYCDYSTPLVILIRLKANLNIRFRNMMTDNGSRSTF